MTADARVGNVKGLARPTVYNVNDCIVALAKRHRYVRRYVGSVLTALVYAVVCVKQRATTLVTGITPTATLVSSFGSTYTFSTNVCFGSTPTLSNATGGLAYAERVTGSAVLDADADAETEQRIRGPFDATICSFTTTAPIHKISDGNPNNTQNAPNLLPSFP